MFIDDLRQQIINDFNKKLSAEEYESNLFKCKIFEPIYALLSIDIDEKIDRYLPKGKELTEDQKDLRNHVILYYIILASVLFSKEFNQPLIWANNPDWKGNKSYNEGLELHAEEIQCLLDLMEYAEPLLTREIERRFPELSENPYINILFYEIYRTQAFNEFKVCLQPYIQIRNNTVIKKLETFFEILKNKGKLPKLKPHEGEKIKVYEDLKKTKNPYLELVYLTCHQAAKAGDETMQELFDQWINSHEEKLSYLIPLRKRTRSSKNSKQFYCVSWNKGQREYYGFIGKENKKDKEDELSLSSIIK